MQKEILSVLGMSCSHCEKAVTNALTELNGVSSVAVDLQGASVTVEYDDSKISVDAIKAEIIDTGYEVK